MARQTRAQVRFLVVSDTFRICCVPGKHNYTFFSFRSTFFFLCSYQSRPLQSWFFSLCHPRHAMLMLMWYYYDVLLEYASSTSFYFCFFTICLPTPTTIAATSQSAEFLHCVPYRARLNFKRCGAKNKTQISCSQSLFFLSLSLCVCFFFVSVLGVVWALYPLTHSLVAPSAFIIMRYSFLWILDKYWMIYSRLIYYDLCLCTSFFFIFLFFYFYFLCGS